MSENKKKILIMMATIKHELMKLLKRAAYDRLIYCHYCGCEPLETDYDKCPICNKSNPLKEHG